MPSCIVRDCRNSTDPQRKSKMQIKEEKYKKISYHKFPRDQYKRKIWLIVLGLVNWDLPKTARICSHHFNESDFVYWSTKRTLKETAVPIPALENICEKSLNDVSLVSKDQKSTYSVAKVNSATSFTSSRLHSSKNIFEKTVNNLNPISKNPKSTYSVPKIVSTFSLVRVSNPPCTTKVDASTCVSPSRLHNTPEKEMIREAYTRQITILRQQLYRSHQQQEHYKKRIEALKPILRSLKKKNLL